MTTVPDGQRDRSSGLHAPRNADLLLPYLAPYGAYVVIATVAAGIAHTADYALRIAVTALLLAILWKKYQPIAGSGSRLTSGLAGAGMGLIGVLLWIALLLPFQDPREGVQFTAAEFALRLAAATLVVPLAEELLFRGYLLGLVTQWQDARRRGIPDPLGVALDKRSVHEMAPGTWTGLGVVISSLAFALGHSPQQWLAAFGYGLLMSILWIWRGDLIAPIAAHAVTNLVLYTFVFFTGNWGLW